MTTKLIPLEYEECTALAQYTDRLIAAGRDIIYTKTVQETYTGFKQIKKNKKMGIQCGLPDYYYIINGQPIWIEMKRNINKKWGGKAIFPDDPEWDKAPGLKPEQRNIMEKSHRAGIPSYVCYGFEGAKLVIDSFILCTKWNDW